MLHQQGIQSPTSKRKQASLVAQWYRIHLPMQETQVQCVGQEDPQRREWQPTPVFLPGKSHEQGTWWATVHGVSKKSDTTQRLNNNMRK